ncbi:hypothetical protein, partial [Falsiroseomonas sp. E2-1-a20]|uniref:hypothetical protein n=1 Tax=Falsiroseomonas sp. E2-1-a20 TaxID=3239300 RepID=UPI003F2E6F73
GFADLQQAKIAWAVGNVAAVPPQLAEPEPTSPSTTPRDGEIGDHPANAPSQSSRSVSAAVAIFVARMRQNKATAKHVIDAQSDLTLLVEAFGSDRPVAKITAADAGRLCEALRSLPPHFRSRAELGGLDLFGKAERSRELGLAPLGFRTVNSYLGTLRNLFNQEVMAGQVAANPFLGKREAKPGRFSEQDRTLR